METLLTVKEAEEKAIIDLFNSRDDIAIEKTDRLFGGLIFTVCNDILGNVQDSEECRNTVYEKLWNSIPPQKPLSLKAYIIKIAKNVSLDRYRSDNARRRIPAGHLDSLSDMSDFLADDYSLDEELDHKELTRVLDKFLRGLEKTDRVVFVRRYLFSDSIEKVSEFTGISVGKIRVILRKTVRKLRKELTDRGILL